MPVAFSNTDDVLDVRDVIKRVEELTDLIEEADSKADPKDMEDEDRAELAALESFLGQLKGSGGDEQWRGDWYPVTLIHDSHFEDYARELAEELGLIPDDAHWPATCIDWHAAAEELQQDYFSVDFDGETYWARS